jgi:hypothetical protein
LVKISARTPKANGVVERWVGTVRTKCLDHVLMFGRRHLQRILPRTHGITTEADHVGPLISIHLIPPLRSEGVAASMVGRHDIPGGLIHEYHRTAA